MQISHLADSEKPLTTLCGLPWDSWQEPDMPTDEEIGLDSLPYAVRVAVRQSDAQRAPRHGEVIHHCQACAKAARRMFQTYPPNRTDQMIDRPDTIIDTEREEAQAARHHEQPGEPGLWTGERWVDRPTRSEAENDER